MLILCNTTRCLILKGNLVNLCRKRFHIKKNAIFSLFYLCKTQFIYMNSNSNININENQCLVFWRLTWDFVALAVFLAVRNRSEWLSKCWRLQAPVLEDALLLLKAHLFLVWMYFMSLNGYIPVEVFSLFIERAFLGSYRFVLHPTNQKVSLEKWRSYLDEEQNVFLSHVFLKNRILWSH